MAQEQECTQEGIDAGAISVYLAVTRIIFTQTDKLLTEEEAEETCGE